MRCRYEAATDRESPTLGTEIDDGRTLGAGGRKTPSQFRELVRPVLKSADNRGTLGRPDVVAWFQVRGRAWPLHRNARLTERREIAAVGDLIAEVVAHGTRLRILYQRQPTISRTLSNPKISMVRLT